MFRALLLVASAVVAAPAAGGQRPVYGGELLRIQMAPLTTLDPARARTFEEIELARNVHATLVERLEDGSFRPYLAASYEAAGAPATRLRLRLPQGLQFQGGKPLTAAEAVASLERLYGVNPWLPLLPGIPGPGALHAVDTLTVEIDLPKPDPRPLLTLLAHPMASITLAPDARGVAPGAGPFAMAEIDAAASRLRLVPFGRHVRGRPYLDAVVVTTVTSAPEQRRALEGGGWTVIDLPAVAEPPRGAEPIVASGEETIVLDLPPGGAAFAPLLDAARTVLDRAAMVSVLLKGRGSVATSLVSPQLFPWRPPAPPGTAPAPPARPARLQLAYPLHDTDLALAAERVKFELRAHVTLEPRGLPLPELRARRERGEPHAQLSAVFLSSAALPLELLRETPDPPPDLSAADTEPEQIATLATTPRSSRRLPLFHRPRRYLVRDGLVGVSGGPWGPPCYADAWHAEPVPPDAKDR